MGGLKPAENLLRRKENKMPQELSRGLKGLVSTSNGDYELAQRKAEETGLSHHCFCINYFDYKYEDKSDKEKSCRWTMCNLL